MSILPSAEKALLELFCH